MQQSINQPPTIQSHINQPIISQHSIVQPIVQNLNQSIAHPIPQVPQQIVQTQFKQQVFEQQTMNGMNGLPRISPISMNGVNVAANQSIADMNGQQFINQQIAASTLPVTPVRPLSSGPRPNLDYFPNQQVS